MYLRDISQCLSNLDSEKLCNEQKSSKLTYHLVVLAKTLKMVKIHSQTFWKMLGSVLRKMAKIYHFNEGGKLGRIFATPNSFFSWFLGPCHSSLVMISSLALKWLPEKNNISSLFSPALQISLPEIGMSGMDLGAWLEGVEPLAFHPYEFFHV